MIRYLVALLVVLLALGEIKDRFFNDKQNLSIQKSVKVSDFEIKGINISHHDGDINWGELGERRLSFIFIKATEGGDFVDDKFESNWKHAQESGYAVGAFHYYKICTDWKLQADNFISVVPITKGALPPVIDLEDEADCKSVADVKYELEMLIDALKQHYGQEPILYVNPIVPDSFFYKYVAGDFYDSVMWYRDGYKAPTPERKWLFWQYNSRGLVEGIKNFTDLDLFQGSRDEFEGLKK